MTSNVLNISPKSVIQTMQGSGASSQSILVHDHVLPPGWSCKYDQKSGKYHFINDKSIFDSYKYNNQPQIESYVSSPRSSPTRTSPALSNSSKNFSFSLKHRISSADGNVNRIYQQFPNVDESYINNLMKLYHNRENLVISALLSEGHARSNLVLDEPLFYKIKAAFPNVETEIIRRMQIKNENREHETIAAILSRFGLFNTTRYEYSKCPQLKLKYLKFAYPDVDELILLDLLFNNDYNVNKVIEHLKNVGYDTSELKIKISKISETELIKEASAKLNAPRPSSLSIKKKYHPTLPEQEQIKKKLYQQFDGTDQTIINTALEACHFDVEQTQLLLNTMTPQDSEKYFQRTFVDSPIEEVSIMVCREVQTNYGIQDLFGTICKKEKHKEIENVKLEDKATCTKEDNIIIEKIDKIAKGPLAENKKGPNLENRGEKQTRKTGPIVKREGPNTMLRKGSTQKCIQNKIAEGPNSNNRIGPTNKRVIRIKDQFLNKL